MGFYKKGKKIFEEEKVITLNKSLYLSWSKQCYDAKEKGITFKKMRKMINELFEVL